jgi:hypothetical protein
MKRISIAAAILAATLSAAPASAATPQPVSFTVQVVLMGDLTASTTAGTFVASGAIADAGRESGSGRFAGQGHLKTGEPNVLHSEITLAGANGSVTIALNGIVGHLPAPLASGDGHWVITAATGDYAGLHGTGTFNLSADFRDAIAHLGPPRVTLHLEGRAG